VAYQRFISEVVLDGLLKKVKILVKGFFLSDVLTSCFTYPFPAAFHLVHLAASGEPSEKR
jgi:hypothetical protein